MPPEDEADPARRRDAGLMLDMTLAAEDGVLFVTGLDEAGFMASRLHQNAVIRSLEVMGEAAGKVSAAAPSAHADIPWREVAGMRHRLIHGYSDVNLELVWQVARTRLPDLLIALRRIVAADRPREG
jgi:uncharacterized protein with HEPN domain